MSKIMVTNKESNKDSNKPQKPTVVSVSTTMPTISKRYENEDYVTRKEKK